MACPADALWALVGDPARLPEWFPGVRVLHRDRRPSGWSVTRAGPPMPEQLLTVDPALRRFQYRITAPIFNEHLGTIDVHDLGDGTSLVVYSVDADPAALALVILGAARAGLATCPADWASPSVPGVTGHAEGIPERRGRR